MLYITVLSNASFHYLSLGVTHLRLLAGVLCFSPGARLSDCTSVRPFTDRLVQLQHFTLWEPCAQYPVPLPVKGTFNNKKRYCTSGWSTFQNCHILILLTYYNICPTLIFWSLIKVSSVLSQVSCTRLSSGGGRDTVFRGTISRSLVPLHRKWNFVKSQNSLIFIV